MAVRRLKLHVPQVPARRSRTRALWLGLASIVLARVLPGRIGRVSNADLRRHDYRTSTQRMGVRFTDRLRDAFRFRWIRRAS